MSLKYEILFSLLGVMGFVSMINTTVSLILQQVKSGFRCVGCTHIIQIKTRC